MSLSDGSEIIIDPNADTVITLKYHNTDFCTRYTLEEFPRPPLVLDWDATSHHDSTVGHDEEMKGAANDDPQIDVKNPESENEGEKVPLEASFFVSSRHLILASTYFKNSLSEKWDQHERDEKDRILIIETGWSKTGFKRLMRIIHGKTRAVSRITAVEEMAEMAQMVDYYDCLEVVEAYSPGWIDQLIKAEYSRHKSNSGVSGEEYYDRNVVMWIYIAWVVHHRDIFKMMTSVAIQGSRSEMRISELPLPEAVVSK
jgi:hypothetical protein